MARQAGGVECYAVADWGRVELLPGRVYVGLTDHLVFAHPTTVSHLNWTNIRGGYLLQIPHDAIESLPGLGAVATFFQFYRPAQFIRLDAGDALPQLTALLTLLARRTGAAGEPLPFSEHHQIVFSLGGVVLLLVRELLHRGLPYDPFTQPQRLVGRFAELVERHYREEGKVEFYANRLRVTADHLSAVLRKTQQDGAKEFIQHRRFREAMLLLETSSLSIKEIAFAIGFEDADYFGRAFRKFQGVPPEAYRREARMVNREKE